MEESQLIDEIIQFKEQLKRLPEVLASLTEDEKQEIITKVEARKAELGL